MFSVLKVNFQISLLMHLRGMIRDEGEGDRGRRSSQSWSECRYSRPISFIYLIRPKQEESI